MPPSSLPSPGAASDFGDVGGDLNPPPPLLPCEELLVAIRAD